MSMEFALNDLQRRRVEEHLALVEQVLRRSIKTNETVDGMDMMICTRKAVSPFAARRFHTGRKWEHFLLTPEPLSEIICWIAAVRSSLREKICRCCRWTLLPRWERRSRSALFIRKI